MNTANHARRRRTRVLMLALACPLLGLAAMPVIGSSDVPPADTIETTRTALEKWVETRRIISTERKDWVLDEEILTQRIALRKDEVKALRESTASAEQGIADAGIKREKLATDADALKGAIDAMEPVIRELEARTAALVKRLPAPIRERVRPLSQKLPEDPDNAPEGVPARFANVIGILNEIDKFNGDITVANEVHPLPDGKSVEVTAMYLGIGQGYYVNADRTLAAIGNAAADGWVWTPANESADVIATAIAIQRNEEPAAFIRMPLRID